MPRFAAAGDLNLVTAVGVYLLLVMLVGTSFNATWRYAGLVGASAPGDDPTATFVQGSIGRVFVPATFACVTCPIHPRAKLPRPSDSSIAARCINPKALSVVDRLAHLRSSPPRL